jgi:hypothetical protein
VNKPRYEWCESTKTPKGPKELTNKTKPIVYVIRPTIECVPQEFKQCERQNNACNIAYVM